jgi:hypothetical protein
LGNPPFRQCSLDGDFQHIEWIGVRQALDRLDPVLPLSPGPHGYAGAKARNDRTRDVMSDIASAADQCGIQEG